MINNKSDALEVLQENDIEISNDFCLMFPRKAEFIDEVHEAIDYLIDEHGYGIRYV